MSSSKSIFISAHWQNSSTDFSLYITNFFLGIPLQGNKADESLSEVMERVVEVKLRSEVNIYESKYVFMPNKSTTDIA